MSKYPTVEMIMVLASEEPEEKAAEAAKETVAGGFSFCKKCAQMSQTMPDGTCQLCRKEK